MGISYYNYNKEPPKNPIPIIKAPAFCQGSPRVRLATSDLEVDGLEARASGL